MSLVITYIGRKGAVMAGDMREIAFQGDSISIEKLEQALYNGQIATDKELGLRVCELGVKIRIRDDKCKISQHDGILIGEVSSFDKGVVRKRRIYASAGIYAIVEIEGSSVELKKKGEGSAFIVFGNEITKKIANQCIRDNWNNGSIPDAIRVIILSMEKASKMTASVSKKYMLLQTTASSGGQDFFKKVENTWSKGLI